MAKKDDLVHLKVSGNLIYVICHNEKQQHEFKTETSKVLVFPIYHFSQWL